MTPKPTTIRWQDLPPDRRRRLMILIGSLIRQRLAVLQEADHEPAFRHPSSDDIRQDPGASL
jgi:hypothetical protein